MYHISIHALLAESDLLFFVLKQDVNVFLSTLSLRRATTAARRVLAWILGRISIHALLAESDHSQRSRKQRHLNFYPRSPCGERQAPPYYNLMIHQISIHALLAESDVMDTLILANAVLFLSTLSLRRATPTPTRNDKHNMISIHALLAESDDISSILMYYITYFYPRSPCGERLIQNQIIFHYNYFYPRSPCGERRH